MGSLDRQRPKHVRHLGVPLSSQFRRLVYDSSTGRPATRIKGVPDRCSGIPGRSVGRRSVGRLRGRLKKKSISIFFGTSEGHFRHHLCKFDIFMAKEIL